MLPRQLSSNVYITWEGFRKKENGCHMNWPKVPLRTVSSSHFFFVWKAEKENFFYGESWLASKSPKGFTTTILNVKIVGKPRTTVNNDAETQHSWTQSAAQYLAGPGRGHVLWAFEIEWNSHCRSFKQKLEHLNQNLTQKCPAIVNQSPENVQQLQSIGQKWVCCKTMLGHMLQKRSRKPCYSWSGKFSFTQRTIQTWPLPTVTYSSRNLKKCKNGSMAWSLWNPLPQNSDKNRLKLRS